MVADRDKAKQKSLFVIFSNSFGIPILNPIPAHLPVPGASWMRGGESCSSRIE
jgi:hypothetical protein